MVARFDPPVMAPAMRTAAPASRMPAPQPSVRQALPTGNGFALALRRSRSDAGDSPGATESASDATALTSGAAKLVPARDDVVSAPGEVSPALLNARKLV